MPIDPKTTALLLIEYQNDFTSEGGALHKGQKAVMESTNMLANSVQVLQPRRERQSVTSMFAPISFAQGYAGDHRGFAYGILKGVVDANAFVHGTCCHRGRYRTCARRHRHRRQARAPAIRLPARKSGLHPSVTRDYDPGRRRIPDQLLV